ncbi:MAG: endolytic transglycosylase MltG [Clostridia bacterium]|nr:endolytic transglycosylase MltG [Clostridia bacterium]
MNQPASENRPISRTDVPAQNDMRGTVRENTQRYPAGENRTDGRVTEMPAQRRPINGEPRAYNRTAEANGRPAAARPSGIQNRPEGQVSNVGRMPQGQNVQSGNTVGHSGTMPAAPRVRTQEPGGQNTQRQTQVPRNSAVQQNRVRPAQNVNNTPAVKRESPVDMPRKPVQLAAPKVKSAGAPEKAKLSKTRVTDISALTHSGKVEKAKKEKTPKASHTSLPREKSGSGEGGNTIVSVVKAVIYMIFVVVVSVFLAVAIILVGNDVFAFVKSDVAVNVKIPENATFDDITDILYENKIIAYPEIFRLYGKLKEEDGPYVAGDFLVSPMTNYGDLMDAFKPQPKSGTSRITIPEGYTTDEIIDLMVSYGIGTREGYEDVIQNYDFDYWFLDELETAGISDDRIYRLDGYLFPDTYDFYNNSSEVTVLNKLLKRFDQLFTDEYREQCAVMGYSVDEVITLASLIEKEAGSAAEFFNVSSVFHNRLKSPANFPCLESDATIAYAIHHETGERPKSINTSYETPYNTYLYKGLPPGPIANPSASAILAALSPAQTKYYFFVSDGSITYFSETKAQHDQYIADIVAKNQ